MLEELHLHSPDLLALQVVVVAPLVPYVLCAQRSLLALQRQCWPSTEQALPRVPAESLRPVTRSRAPALHESALR